MPLLLLPIAGLLGYSWATKSTQNDILQTAQETNGGINFTKVAGYAILATGAYFIFAKVVK